jgi:adhesin transport system outer membrane protein
MKVSHLILSGIVLLCLRGGTALAAPHLTLKEVAQKVVLTNPEVLAKWHAFKAAGGDVDVARAGFFPRIDYTYGTGKEDLQQPGVADRDYNRNGHVLTLNQMLYDGFATASDVKRLDKARLTRYFELLDAAEAAALEAGRAYYDVIRYRQLMLLAEGNYIEHRSSYELLLRRAQSGAGRRVDVEHAAGRLALAELNLNTEAANLHDVTARYLRLVGEQPPSVMFGPARLERGYPASEEEALRLAFKQSPALLAAVENVEAAQHDLELRRSAFHPRLDLRLRNDRAENVDGVMGLRQQNVAEVVLSYNLFNGGADKARQTASAERKNQALDLRDKACRDVRQTLSIAYNEVRRLQAQRSSIDHQVNAIEKTRDAYKAQFNIGQRSLLDLLDTENELLNARRTAVNADADMDQAYLRTQAGIGTPARVSRPEADRRAGGAGSRRAGAGRRVGYLSALSPQELSGRPRSPDGARTGPAGRGQAGARSDAAAIAGRTCRAARQFATAGHPAGARRRLVGRLVGQVLRQLCGFLRAVLRARRRCQPRRLGEAARAAPGDAETDPGRGQNLKLKQAGNDMLLAEFEQHYSSDGYSDVTQKELKWVRVGGQWLIERETARPAGVAATARKKGET